MHEITHTCSSCGGDVPDHAAVLRGDALHDQPTAWHRWCWELTVDAVQIPAPRGSAEFATPLRLAE